jgi:O-antigen ligase
MSLGQALFNRDLAKPLRILLAIIGLSATGYNTIFRTEWVSGWIPSLIVIMALLFLWNWRIGLTFAIISGLTVFTYYGVINTRVNTETQQWSTFTRIETWPIIWNIFKANPLLGVGPGNYYFYTPIFFYLGYFVQFNTHNNFFDIALQSGLVGLVAFFWLIAVAGLTGWSLRHRNKGNFRNAYANSVLAGLVASLAAGLLADWFLPFLYNIGISGFSSSIFMWIFIGGLLVLASLPSARETEFEAHGSS